ncbi:MAG: hypothetical protein V5A51_09255 [Bacteroidales bacterium]|nr:hypothetical protein [Bacteroidales bacterium]
MTDYQQYFTLIGQLDQETESGFRYMPLFLKSRKVDFDKILEVESDMQALLLDGGGEVVLRVPLSYGYYCNDTEKLPQLAVRGYIPFDERTRAIRFEYKQKIIDEFRVPEARPEINITSEIPRRIDQETLDLKWKTSYKGEASLQHKVFYTNNGGETWQPVGNRTGEQQMEIDVTELPGGENCRFTVQVTDGYNNASDETGEFVIQDKPYEAFILSPLDGEVLGAGRSVLLTGQGYDPNSGREINEGFVWSSSKDGELGKGSLLQTKLSEGKHTIKLQIGKSTQSVGVRVE